jgi:hypothetical protein
MTDFPAWNLKTFKQLLCHGFRLTAHRAILLPGDAPGRAVPTAVDEDGTFRI